MARVFDPGSPRLFNHATPARRRRGRATVFAIGAVIAAMVAAVFWLSGDGGDDQSWMMPGLIGLGLGAFVPVSLFGRQRPSLVCADCGAAGWVEDVKETGGRCPRCGSSRFQPASRRVEESDGDSVGVVIMGADICSGVYDDSDSGCGDSDSGDSDCGGDSGGGDGGGGGD